MDEYMNDIAQELAMLQTLTGIDFSRKLEQICQRREFHPVVKQQTIRLQHWHVVSKSILSVILLLCKY